MGVAKDETVLVRIKPHNPKRGYRLRRYLVYGMKYEERLGWYRIKRVIRQGGQVIDVAAYLKQIRNDENDNESPLAFDVCSQEEATVIEEREKKERARKASAKKPRASEPIDLTSSEVRHLDKKRKAAEIEDEDEESSDA